MQYFFFHKDGFWTEANPETHEVILPNFPWVKAFVRKLSNGLYSITEMTSGQALDNSGYPTEEEAILAANWYLQSAKLDKDSLEKVFADVARQSGPYPSGYTLEDFNHVSISN